MPVPRNAGSTVPHAKGAACCANSAHTTSQAASPCGVLSPGPHMHTAASRNQQHRSRMRLLAAPQHNTVQLQQHPYIQRAPVIHVHRADKSYQTCNSLPTSQPKLAPVEGCPTARCSNMDNVQRHVKEQASSAHPGGQCMHGLLAIGKATPQPTSSRVQQSIMQ
jgi:hypothetical protein